MTEWLKKQLEMLANWLKALVGKAAAALPGILGSIVSWILSTLEKAIGFVASHVWAALLAIGALIHAWLGRKLKVI